jgi:DNA-binding Lrp family transcriptional regulator
MNGRMSMAKLAKRLGMSTTGARHFVKRLEEKYHIRYFAEVDMLKLGFMRYIALVKFESRIPSFDEVKEAFKSDPHVVLAAMTKGIYDMIVLFYIENTESPTLFLYNWRSSQALPDYAAKWYVAPLGKSPEVTLPIRPRVIEWVTTNLVNEGEAKSRMASKLTRIERLTLKELVLDGNQNFKDLDKRYGLSQGRSNYAFYKLKEKGIIERITITISPPNLRYNAVFITETNHYKKFIEVQHQYRLSVINQENPVVNKNAYRGDMGMPDSILHIRPIFRESEFQKARSELDSIAGTKTDSLIITDMGVGYLCYRNFDFAHAPIYSDLLKQGKIPALKKIDY